MSILIPSTEPGVLEDIGTIRTYNPVVGAYEDCERAYTPVDGVWEKVWPDDRELIIFENGEWKNLPGNWVGYADGGIISLSVEDGLLRVQGTNSSANWILKDTKMDLSAYTKLCIDTTYISCPQSYACITPLLTGGDFGYRTAYWLYDGMAGRLEIPFEDFEGYSKWDAQNAHFGFFINYNYYMLVRKISFLK